MARTRRNCPPPNRGTEKLSQLKRENHQLRSVNKRYRRDLKNMRTILNQLREAVNNGDLLRAAALLPRRVDRITEDDITECGHKAEFTYCYVCRICKEII